MSRFLGRQAAALTPYTPGEQPQDRRYIKLNTNECPYPPAPGVAEAIRKAAAESSLYPDPEAAVLKKAFAKAYGVDSCQVFVCNGSDEALAFAFMAFFDRGDEVYFPDPSYGFYPVYADLCGLKAHPVPLREDFSLSVADYEALPGNIVIANPNAPTGLALSRDKIEQVLISNPDRLVLIDEAYVDFADDASCLPLLEKYDNLLIVGTLSKSRSLAGLRLGYAISRPETVAALERIKYSFNPYNVNRATQAAGVAALEDADYFYRVTGMVKSTRDKTANALRDMGLKVLPSCTNFLYVSHMRLSGRELYLALREKSILVRSFSHPRTEGFVRISIGTDSDMDSLLLAIGALG